MCFILLYSHSLVLRTMDTASLIPSFSEFMSNGCWEKGKK